MALEAIKEIRESETEAGEIVKSATNQAKDDIKKAIEEAQTKYDDILVKAKERASSLIDEAIHSGNKEASPILEKGKKESEDIRNIDGNKKNNAVKLVVERIVKIHGNS